MHQKKASEGGSNSPPAAFHSPRSIAISNISPMNDASKRPRGRPRKSPGLDHAVVVGGEVFDAGSALPHDFLLAIMQGRPILQVVTDDYGNTSVQTQFPDLKSRISIGKYLISYHMPRLSAQAVDVRQDVGSRLEELMVELGERLPE